MIPPWEKYPDYPEGDLGWRMGAGESYLHSFFAWWGSLDARQREDYAEQHPEPDEWKGFYF